MVEIQKVIRCHNCFECGRRLKVDMNRINFEIHNYCLSCGCKKIKERIKELEDFIEKYGKEIVIDKMIK